MDGGEGEERELRGDKEEEEGGDEDARGVVLHRPSERRVQ